MKIQLERFGKERVGMRVMMYLVPGVCLIVFSFSHLLTESSPVSQLQSPYRRVFSALSSSAFSIFCCSLVHSRPTVVAYASLGSSRDPAVFLVFRVHVHFSSSSSASLFSLTGGSPRLPSLRLNPFLGGEVQA